MLERDRSFPTPDELNAELDTIATAANGAGGALPSPTVPSPTTPRPAGPVHEPARNQLAAEQAALVAALVRSSPPPPGFRADRLAIAATALSEKRAREGAGREAVATGSPGRS